MGSALLRAAPLKAFIHITPGLPDVVPHGPIHGSAAKPFPASERRACPTALAGHASDHRSPPNPVAWNWHSTPADAAFARESCRTRSTGMEKEVVFFQAQEGQVIGYGQACARASDLLAPPP